MNENGQIKRERLNEEFYQSVPNILLNDLRDKKLKPTDVVVYMVFADHQRDKSDCWVSNKTVANFLGYERATIGRSLDKLEAAGHIVRSAEKTAFGTRRTSLLTKVVKSKVIRGNPPMVKSPLVESGDSRKAEIHTVNNGTSSRAHNQTEKPALAENAEQVVGIPFVSLDGEPAVEDVEFQEDDQPERGEDGAEGEVAF